MLVGNNVQLSSLLDSPSTNVWLNDISATILLASLLIDQSICLSSIPMDVLWTIWRLVGAVVWSGDGRRDASALVEL